MSIDSHRVVARHLAQKVATNTDVLSYLLPVEHMFDLVEKLERAGDTQSAKLAQQVYYHIQEKLELANNESNALKRLIGCVNNKTSWDPGLLRNNIFKAADELRIKLPSFMFS